MTRSCRFEGCTVDETGSCALEHDPATCNNRTQRDQETSGDERVVTQSADHLGAPVLLAQPARMSPFVSSRSLGLEDLNALMGDRYVNVIGILGDPESGKTACLASLYLLVSNAKLEGWGFADSKSLAAFEEIARGARDWNNGEPPEQMTLHTELADDRRPGFLHLRLVRNSDGRLVDFALPDVPGEWTQKLVTSARSDRLEYMKSADVIWIVLDGLTLSDIEKRQGLIARVGQLAGRLNTMFSGGIPRLLIVITHCDSYRISEDVASRLQRELSRRGATAEIIGVAPFSDRPNEVSAGFGIADLIDKTVGRPAERPIFWKSTDADKSDRVYLSFRRDR